MKRKLSLLLAMVLAMTMVMGISVTAFAITQLDITVTPLTSADLGNSLPTDNLTVSPSIDFEIMGYYLYNSNKEAIYVYFPGMGYADAEGPLTGDPDWSKVAYIIEAFEMGPVTRDSGFTVKVNGRILPYDADPDGIPINEMWTESGSSITGFILVYEGSTPGPNPDPDPIPTPAHVHNFQWQTITAPTKETDGLEGEVCSCGAVRNTQPLSAYGYALNEYATPMINAAKSGQTITFEFGEWNSFPKSFMAKLVDKSAQNVTFVFHYKWNHVKQEITIPAGTPIDLNFDWYGPAKMAELYGAN